MSIRNLLRWSAIPIGKPARAIAVVVFAFGFNPSTSSAGIEPFIGEIETFAFTFCPKGWAPLNGQLLPINQNQALFSLLGTNYGGDGRVTFALPTGKPVHTLKNGATLLQCIALTGIFPSRD